jgi:DNA-binding FrmR family transcriptional regulator
MRGETRMVADDRYCIEIPAKIQAARAALQQVEL